MLHIKYMVNLFSVSVCSVNHISLRIDKGSRAVGHTIGYSGRTICNTVPINLHHMKAHIFLHLFM